MEKSRELRAQIETYLEEEHNNEPITEQRNRLTTNIDLAKSGRDIFELLEQTDREIFDGWLVKPPPAGLRSDGLKNDRVIIDKLTRLADLIGSRMERRRQQSSKEAGRFRVVMSGCGTSGRIAYLCAKTFNLFFGCDICEYIIAGGEYALVNSVEAVEDKPDVGEKELTRILTEENTECIYIGITCGLSAPFVGGQLSYCIDQLEQEANNKSSSKIIACALIGFNPVNQARRTVAINSRQENFHDLLSRMSALEEKRADEFFVLNPYIGPEPITGSSRMKSGTATKIMLDVILTRAAAAAVLSNVTPNIDDMIGFYERVMNDVVYRPASPGIDYIIDRAANSLRNLTSSGSINYLSDSESLGFLACVDASECVPTYGAMKNDIKGFVSASNGTSLSGLATNKPTTQWSRFLQTCQPVQSENILKSIEQFKSANCLFIIIDDDEKTCECVDPEFPTSKNIESRLVTETSAEIIHLRTYSGSGGDKQQHSNRVKVINIGDEMSIVMKKASETIGRYFGQCLREFGIKLVLNAISTGAHVLIGKTYENIMIDVRVSNVKLYYRAVGILRRLSGRDERECEQALLTTIYAGQDRSSDSIVDHVEHASAMTLVVPIALFMLLAKCPLQTAQEVLYASRNSVRNCIFKLKNELN